MQGVSLINSVFAMSALTFLSRILAVVRDAVLASLFPRYLTDAWLFAVWADLRCAAESDGHGHGACWNINDVGFWIGNNWCVVCAGSCFFGFQLETGAIECQRMGKPVDCHQRCAARSVFGLERLDAFVGHDRSSKLSSLKSGQYRDW